MKKIKFKNKKEKIIVYGIYYFINIIMYLLGIAGISAMMVLCYYIGLVF